MVQVEITSLGYVLIPIIVLTTFLKRDWLLYETVLFSPLQASAVLNFHSITFGLQSAHLAGSLWIFFCIVDIAWKGFIRISAFEVRKVLKGIWIFGIWAFITALIMPFIFKSKVEILTPEAETMWLKPLRLNFTQSLYLLWGILFPTIMVLKLSERQIRNVSKIILLTGGLTIVFGVYQLCASLFNWPMFEALFFNNCGFSQGFRQVVGPIKRMSSFFTEPSMYASFMSGLAATTVAMVFLRVRNKHKITGSFRKEFISLFLGLFFLVGLLLSTSTTAFAVFFLGLSAGAFYFFLRRQIQNLIIVFSLGIISASIVVLGWLLIGGGITALSSAMSSVTTGKMETLSGIERFSWDTRGLQVLLGTYGLGAGWGSNRASSLLLTIASNTGFIGVFLFIWTIVVGWRLIRKINKMWPSVKTDTILVIAISASIGVLSILMAGVIAVPDIYFIHLWMFVGLMLSAANTVLLEAKALNHPTELSNGR